jgi:hypothetical protein
MLLLLLLFLVMVFGMLGAAAAAAQGLRCCKWRTSFHCGRSVSIHLRLCTI